MVVKSHVVPTLRRIERQALASLDSTRTFVALGFFPALLCREVNRRRFLRLWHTVREGELPTARKYALVGHGPGVDPASQERTYFDCLAAVDSFRENDDLSVPEPEFEDTPLDKLLDEFDRERPPVANCDEWNAWQERKFAAICGLAHRQPGRDGTWLALYFCGGTRIVQRVSLTMGATGWLSLPMTVDVVGSNESQDSDDSSHEPALPVIDWEHGIARKPRTHEPVPVTDIDFFETEIKVHHWWTGIEVLDWGIEQNIDVLLDGTQSRYEDLVLYSGYVSEAVTATMNVGEVIA